MDEFAWILVGDIGGEIGGVQFGIEYDSGVNVATEAWTLCSGGAEIPEAGWPSSGTGQAATWPGGCAPSGGDDLAAVGFLYVRGGSRGRIRLTADPRVDAIQMTNCTAPHPDLIEACAYNGTAAFGGENGFRPENCRCSGPPVETGTWTSIKTRYGQ